MKAERGCEKAPETEERGAREGGKNGEGLRRREEKRGREREEWGGRREGAREERGRTVCVCRCARACVCAFCSKDCDVGLSSI